MSERLNVNAQFDVLGDVLETLRFRGSVFFRSQLAAPWGMELIKPIGPRFHIAMSGRCVVGITAGEQVQVNPNDVVMIPNGHSHWIADEHGRELASSDEASEACMLGDPMFQGGKITNSLICGLVNLERRVAHPLLDALPAIVHFPNLASTSALWSTINLIDGEMHRAGHHGGPIVDRLTEVLFLQLLDRFVSEHHPARGFLAALADRRISQALSLIHQEPEFDWSLAALGERIGMSRATLVRHFQDTVGVSPMTYIVNWRLMKAYNLIRYSNVNFEDIALQVGFASARTLSRAFKRQYGRTPSEVRKG
ncbi:MAG: AraC family transcriptional regulator [Gammaproteobacteria bacterium]|nr:AraC family transcriptional regulator [Gammaproteobacteria bacterium]